MNAAAVMLPLTGSCRVSLGVLGKTRAVFEV